MSKGRDKHRNGHFLPVLTLFALLLRIGPAQAFFRHLCYGELATGRIDPIMSPGEPSQHLHVTFGSSGLSFDVATIEDLLNGNCSSCSILQDHSAYWAPMMYFQHSNGTLQMVPTDGGMTVYYFTEGPGYDIDVVAYPQNFRMIAGSSNKRAFYGSIPDPPMSQWTDYDRTQQSLMEKALGFNCLHYDQPPNEGAMEYHYLRNKTFIDATCTDGIRAELMFPSCWNGQDLDSENHTTHIAYPYEVKYGDCPAGYPVRLPVLFYETIYQTTLFNGSDGQFVFSNGDPTGFGYHGDFIAGWDNDILQEAINSTVCTNGDSSGLQEDCPVFLLQNSSDATQCKLETPAAIQNEPINFVPVLPGSIQIQSGPQSATMAGVHAPSPSAAGSSLMANNTVSGSPPTPTPGPTAAASAPFSNVTSAITEPVSNVLTTVTTTYMSDNVEVHMVLVEEIVTVTVSNIADLPGDRRKRHWHKRGHRT